MGLAASLSRSHPSSWVTLLSAIVQCYLWHRGMCLLATGQVDWDHCILIKLLVWAYLYSTVTCFRLNPQESPGLYLVLPRTDTQTVRGDTAEPAEGSAKEYGSAEG